MKKIFVFIFIATCINAVYAQTNFEGIVKWNLTMSGTSNAAATQKELTSAQKEDLKKSIAELEVKLNDPSMQAAFQSNPYLKTMLEQQLATMKSMQGDNGVGGLVPKSFTVKMKDGNSYTQVEGGAMATAGDILHLKTVDKTYYIKKSTKTYSLAPQSKPTSTTEATVTVTPTTETIKILNYTCTKYIVLFTEAGKTKTMTVWATKDLKQYSSGSFQTGGVGNPSHVSALKKIDGVPLKIEMTEQGQTVVMEVVELKNTTLAASEFILPLDYKEVPFGQ